MAGRGRGRGIGRRAALAACLLCAAACMREHDPLPDHAFAFAVFGDGPYVPWQSGRFRRLIKEVNRSELQWFIHLGDMLAYPCSDRLYQKRLAAMNSIRHPVIYTPGDNEWSDCHGRRAGSYRPVERLERIRELFFPEPGVTLGGRRMRVETQSVDAAFSRYVENVRWKFGRFLFVAVHVVGSSNATHEFAGRTEEDDQEAADRTRAALAWIDAAFDILASEDLSGVVLIMHGNPGLRPERMVEEGYQELMDRLELRLKGTTKPVLLIHGDSHRQRVDHPLKEGTPSRPITRFTRLETFGSPDIGWIRVIIDSVQGRVLKYEPRLISPLWLW